MKQVLLTIPLCILCLFFTAEASPIIKKIPVNSKVFVAPMDGFETYVIAAIHKKGVPIQVVGNREHADYEIKGTAESEKPGWAKVIFTGQTHSNEQASITLMDTRTGEIVFAYAVNKSSALRGKQSAAESCAKHLKGFVEDEKR